MRAPHAVMWGIFFLAVSLALAAEPAPPAVPAPNVTELTPQQRLAAALARLIDVDFDETPFRDAVDALSRKSGVLIVVDRRLLAATGASTDPPITLHLKGVPFRVVLNQFTKRLDATWRSDIDTVSGGTQPQPLIYLIDPANELVETHTFDLRPLLAALPETQRSDSARQLVLVMQSLVPRNRAGVSGLKSVSSFREMLLVNGTAAAHGEVGRVLGELAECQQLGAKWDGKASLPSTLSKPIVENAGLREALRKPLGEALGTIKLRDLPGVLAKRFGINVVLDYAHVKSNSAVVADETVRSDLVGVTLSTTLALMLDDVQFTAQAEEGVLVLSQEERAAAEVRVYPIFDLDRRAWSKAARELDLRTLDASAANKLAESDYAELVRNIASETWDKVGGRGTIAYCRPAGALVISQDSEVHERIAAFLSAYRALLREVKANPNATVAVDLHDSEARRQLDRRLNATLGALKLGKVPLERALRELCARQQLPVAFDNAGLKLVGAETTEPVSCDMEEATLAQALTAILEPLGLQYAPVNNELILVQPLDSNCDFGSWRLYPVGDLVRQEANVVRVANLNGHRDELVKALKETVAAEQWDTAGGAGYIAAAGTDPILAIHQKRKVHEQIAEFLATLRKSRH